MTNNRRLVDSSRNRRRFMSVVAAAALALTLALPAAALAAPYDRTDPMQTGCANSAQTVAQRAIYDPLGGSTNGPLGYVQVRYSTTCHTKWARVVTYNGSQSWMEAFAQRLADGVSTYGYGGDPGPWYGSAVYSDQVYGYNTVVCANSDFHAYFGWTGWVSVCA